jgi:FkbM family methyltransferase
MNYNPYETTMKVAGRDISYTIRSKQGAEWYDPIKPHTQLEYDWVAENIPLDGQIVIDAGCHQGNYAAMFAAFGATVIGIDVHMNNCKMTMDQLGPDHRVIHRAIWPENDTMLYNGKEHGLITSLFGRTGGVPVKTIRLQDVVPAPDVVKMDIENAEHAVLPDCIDEMQNVKWWIIEAHKKPGDPHDIAKLFVTRGYEVLKVDREQFKVIPYDPSGTWPTHSTLIARRK